MNAYVLHERKTFLDEQVCCFESKKFNLKKIHYYGNLAAEKLEKLTLDSAMSSLALR